MNQTAFDQRLGGAVVGLRDALDEVAAVNAMLQDTTILGQVDGSPDPLDALGYSADDITNIRNGMFTLSLLTMVAHAQANLPSASDFFFFAKHLGGARW